MSDDHCMSYCEKDAAVITEKDQRIATLEAALAAKEKELEEARARNSRLMVHLDAVDDALGFEGGADSAQATLDRIKELRTDLAARDQQIARLEARLNGSWQQEQIDRLSQEVTGARASWRTTAR